MPDRRGRKASIEDLLPENRSAWARDIWADRHEVIGLPSMLEAARTDLSPN